MLKIKKDRLLCILAIIKKNVEIEELLRDKKAKLNIKDKDGKTALDYKAKSLPVRVLESVTSTAVSCVFNSYNYLTGTQ